MTNPSTISPAGIALIKSFESCSLTAYQVPGDIPTIGWGNTYYEDNSKVKLGQTITQRRADQLFENLVNRDFASLVTETITVPLTQHQFDALCSYAYNVAPKTFRNSPIVMMVNADPTNPKISEVWVKTNVRPGSKFTKGLTRRRTAEAKLYFQP